MYNRLHPGRKGLRNEFIDGVEYFINVAMQLSYFQNFGQIRCPCSNHRNQAFLSTEEVKLDLYRRGFQPDYWYWTSHGEFEPHVDVAAETSTIYESPPIDSHTANFEEMMILG